MRKYINNVNVLKRKLLFFLKKFLLDLTNQNSRRDFNHVAGLFKRFPNMDITALKQQYPDVDIEKAKNSKRARGHYAPK